MHADQVGAAAHEAERAVEVLVGELLRRVADDHRGRMRTGRPGLVVGQEALAVELGPGVVGGEDVQRLAREGPRRVGGGGRQGGLEPFRWDLVAELRGPARQRCPAHQRGVRHDPVRNAPLLERPDRRHGPANRLSLEDDHAVEVEEEGADAVERCLEVGRGERHGA